MKSETDTLTQTPEDVLHELRSLVDEVEKIIGQSPNGHSETVVAALHERFEAAQERLAAFYESARKRVVEGAKYTDTTIRENPYQSLAIALGLGVLAGVLIGRRIR